jgi:tripartite-type tricarboxylate transporter receptor subunit TctC
MTHHKDRTRQKPRFAGTAMLNRRNVFAVTLALAICQCAGNISRAQDWPSKPVKIVAAFGAGGTADELGRLLAPELSVTFKQQFYVENRPGNSGSLGSTAVARSAPDGYTLLIGGAGPLLISPAVNPNISYNTMKDFTHIALLVGDIFMLAVSPALKARSLNDLRAIAKDRPLPCGAVGAGSHGDLLQQIIKREVGLNLTLVPYRGAAENVVDLLGGHVMCSVATAVVFAEQVKAGKVIPIAVATSERSSAFPDVPTFAELGYPDISGVAWFWLAGPKNLPSDVVAKLNQEVRRIVRLPKAKEMFARASLMTRDADVATVDAFIAHEVATWGKIAKEIGLTVQ